MNRSNLIPLRGIVTLAALILPGCNFDSQRPDVVRGPVLVYYEIQTSPSGTADTGDSGEEVSEIRFLANHVVLVKKDGEKGTRALKARRPQEVSGSFGARCGDPPGAVRGEPATDAE